MPRSFRQQWKLEVGCLVYLRSGSCRMVVTNVTPDYVEVVWQHYDTKQVFRENVPVGAVNVCGPAPDATDEKEEK